MKKGLIGKKLGMTQIFDEKGNVIPVTVIEAGPCVVAQIKTEDNDGYNAVQLGFGDVKDKHILRDFLLCIACLSNGVVDFIKLGLSSIFPFKDPLQIHSIVNAVKKKNSSILCF